MTLVENAKESWKWFSMQAMTLAGAVQGAWLIVPPDMKDTIPSNLVQYLTIGLVFAGIIGRLVKQDAVK